MKVSIDTKEDSHEEIKKVIKMLQNLVGAEEIFTNELSVEPSVSGQSNAEPAGSAFANIFGGSPADSSSAFILESSQSPSQPFQPSQQAQQIEEKQHIEEKETGSAEESTQDLFAELFSEEELNKMDIAKEDDEKEVKPKDRKYNIELY